MLTVNLFDAAFAHLTCSVHGKTARHVRYVRSRLEWDGITVLTDDMLCKSRTLDHLRSRVTVGWLLEPREYKPDNYVLAEALLPRLDLLLTHDQELIDRHPNKVRFVPFGGCWVREENFGLHAKWPDIPRGPSGNVSMIFSAKKFMPGHQLRFAVAERFKPAALHMPRIRYFGAGSVGIASGCGEILTKEYGLATFKFSIAIENSRARNFFTEKLLDCFAVGTVPIYWGCPNLADFFDMRGVIPFERVDELPAILRGLNYGAHLDGARVNLERMRQYEIADDWIATNVLPDLMEEMG